MSSVTNFNNDYAVFEVTRKVAKNGRKYILFILNSGNDQVLERWKNEIAKYMETEAAEGSKEAIVILDNTKNPDPPNFKHSQAGEELIDKAVKYGFKQITLYYIKNPNNQFNNVIMTIISSIASLQKLVSIDKYNFSVVTVDSVAEAEQKIENLPPVSTL